MVLDLFAVIIGWSVNSSVRDRHREWSEQMAALRERARRLRNVVLDSGEEQVYAALDPRGPAPAGPAEARPVLADLDMDHHSWPYPYQEREQRPSPGTRPTEPVPASGPTFPTRPAGSLGPSTPIDLTDSDRRRDHTDSEQQSPHRTSRIPEGTSRITGNRNEHSSRRVPPPDDL
jgi:hypothetical protein